MRLAPHERLDTLACTTQVRTEDGAALPDNINSPHFDLHPVISSRPVTVAEESAGLAEQSAGISEQSADIAEQSAGIAEQSAVSPAVPTTRLMGTEDDV